MIPYLINACHCQIWAALLAAFISNLAIEESLNKISVLNYAVIFHYKGASN